MTPVLYDAGEKDFGRGGIGQLTDALSCVVTEERNGAFELMLEYPVDGALYAYIGEGCMIKAKPNDTAAPQLFRIYRSTKPINMRVTYYAEHISYLLGGMPVERVEVAGATAQTAMRRILESCIVENDFEAESDIELTSSLSLSLVSARAALGGVEGSVLDVYGGEFEFDNYKIKLHAHRGRDTGVIVAYGKNLTDFAQDKNIAEMYTGVLPFARYTITNEDGSEGGDVTVTIPGLTLTSPNAGALPYPRILIKDFSSAFDGSGEITQEMLLSKAQSWASTSGYDAPKINITVAFQNLWQSPEYAEFAELEKVSLCDTVTVSFERLGITAKAKVIKTVYDVLRERYNSVELGDAKANFADTVSGFGGDLTALETRMRERVRGVGERVAETNRAIKKFSEALSNASGLYHTEEVQPNGSTVYYLHDRPLLADSVTVIKITNAAIFFSRDGGKSYPYAIGYDGEALLEKIYAVGINADYIKTGRLEISNDEGDVVLSIDIDKHTVTISGDSVRIGGKSAAEAMNENLAAAKKYADDQVGKAMTHEQIFYLLTDGGRWKGIYQFENELYISATYVKSGTMSADRISGGSIDATDVTIKNLSASSITSGSLSADRISGGSIDATDVTIKNLSASSITSGSLSADRISGGTLDASKIAVKNLQINNVYYGKYPVVLCTEDSMSRITISIGKDQLSNNVSSATLTLYGTTINVGDEITTLYNVNIKAGHVTITCADTEFGSVKIGSPKIYLIVSMANYNSWEVKPSNNSYKTYLGTSSNPWAYGYITDIHIATSAQIGTSTSAKVGFFGTTPIARKSVAAASTSSSVTASSVATSLNNLITALKNYGLISS